MDLAGEPDEIYDLYGPDAREPGTYAANCLLARRLAERGVRFIQLYHQGWDQHGNLPRDIRRQCEATDQASAALVIDLKRRGLLEDTLVIWGGEFGRTSYCQGPLTQGDYGRDHHPRCFTIWLAGAGVKSGFSYGESDELGYNIVRDPVHVHDLQATILYLLGVDHERLVFRHQGRRFRLTDVHGHVVKDIPGLSTRPRRCGRRGECWSLFGSRSCGQMILKIPGEEGVEVVLRARRLPRCCASGWDTPWSRRACQLDEPVDQPFRTLHVDVVVARTVDDEQISDQAVGVSDG